MHTVCGRLLLLASALFLAGAPGLADTLVLKDGREIRGYYEGGNPRVIRFRTEDRTREYDLLTVARIRIDGQTAAGPTRPDSEFRDFFLPEEVRLIRGWFSRRSNLERLPPGLAKRDSLPPGLARQVRKNGTLPPGLERRVQPLPWDLERQLPVLTGMRRVMISGSVVLLDESNSVIVDLIADVF